MLFARKIFFSSFVLILLSTSINGQDMTEWLNPEITAINTLNPTSTPIPFATELEAKSFDITKSSHVKILSGNWKFKWFKNYKSVTKDLLTSTIIDTQGWDIIPVPSYWQVAGLGAKKNYDKPYFNKTFPDYLKNKNTLIQSDSNAVGIYVTHFTLPTIWQNKTVILNFEGVKSACYVWINGKKVGYSENSGSPFSFQIESYLKQGDNQIAVQVLKWSDGLFLENRNSWQVSGIFKDVYLTMHNDVRIEDLHVIGDLDEQLKDGKLSIKATLRNHKNQIHYNQQVSFSVYDASHKLIGASKEKEVGLLDSTSKLSLSESFIIPSVIKWNAEQPYLYSVIVQLKNDKGAITETISQKIGFRKIAFRSNQLLLNGKAITLKGVNINTSSPTIYTTESIHRELQLMKQHNINAIWVNGTTPRRKFYELCDDYGFYVIDQVNIQTQNTGQNTSNAIGELAYTARARSLWEYNKNHPSIIGWSVGSDSGQDQNFGAIKTYLQLVDTSRPLLYRDREEISTQFDIATSTSISPTALSKLPKELSKPTLLASISKTHGNGLGGIELLWKEILKSPARQGGFIDNWASNTIVYQAPDKSRNFFRNYAPQYFPQGGVVSAIGDPEPELTELKKVFESVLILTADTIDLQKRLAIITNKFDFQSLNDFMLQWNVFENGKSIQKGTLELNGIRPNESKELRIPIEWPAQPRADGNYYLHLSIVAKQDLHFYKKGHEIARKQVPLRIAKIPSHITLQQLQPLRMNFLRGVGIEISGSNFSLTFDKETAQMSSFVYNDKEFLESGFNGNFWRVPVVLDQLGEKVNLSELWKAHSLDSLRTLSSDLRVEKLHQYAFKVTMVKRVAARSGTIQINSIYTIFSTGDIQVQYAFIPQGNLPPLPRFGLQMSLRENLEEVTWFGRGPHESYADRKGSAFIGLYSGKIKDQHHDYSTLQETGNKSDVQWFAIQDPDKDGLLFVGDSLLNFNIQNYVTNDLVTAQKTRTELTRGLQNSLSIDMIQEGLHFNFQRNGVESMTSMGTRRFSFRIKPINAQTDFFKEANSRLPIVVKKSIEITNNNERE